jgi:regulator of nonsense transcripts 1
VDHNLEGKEITEVISYGKDFTKAELDLGDIILSMLQGTLCLLDNYWMRAIWLPFELLKSFVPPSEVFNTEIMAHPIASINPSQSLAITKILSLSFDTKITLVQGPPGTGKTTVIATYVKSAIYAGQRGIWLMAQSNVAVKNIAEKLAKLGFLNFKLLVSFEFHHQW